MNSLTLDKNDPEIRKFLDKIYTIGFSENHLEQLVFRIYCCKNCLEEKKCKFCQCNPLDKVKEPISCNPKVYPDMKKKDKWEDYKTEHNITIL